MNNNWKLGGVLTGQAVFSVLFFEYFTKNEDPHLRISPSFYSTAVPRITEFLKEREYERSVSETAEPRPDNILQTLPHKAQGIHHYIANHANCKLNDIVSGMHIPKSTITRYLKEMQYEGLIEYAGSKKTGGYRVKL